jgi:hypothetical protein
LHFAGFNVSNASACFGFPAFLDSRTEMKPLGQSVHQLHDLLSWQVASLFNNLIQRHRHGTNLPTTEPKLKSEAEILRVHSSRNPCTRAAVSGKFVLRVEPAIHRRLTAKALAEGGSPNTYYVKALVKA